MSRLQHLQLPDFILPDQTTQTIHLSYELFGQPLHQAPLVLVNHALTGNSTVAGEKGWWNNLIGWDKAIDLNRYTVLAFNIPGNGYEANEEHLIHNYTSFTTALIGTLFWKGLEKLGITHLYAIIGGSLGGSIAWEMTFQKPNAVERLIPIATSYQSSDWLIGQVLVQEAILNHSTHPLEDARKHAMLLYRTPDSLTQKFNRKHQEKEQQYAVESWLNYHGKILNERFQLVAYRLLNHLLKTTGAQLTEAFLLAFAQTSPTAIHIIAVDTDYMFTQKEQKQAFQKMALHKANLTYQEIQSIHGHDAFLLEYEQLNNLLQRIF